MQNYKRREQISETCKYFAMNLQIEALHVATILHFHQIDGRTPARVKNQVEMRDCKMFKIIFGISKQIVLDEIASLQKSM